MLTEFEKILEKFGSKGKELRAIEPKKARYPSGSYYQRRDDNVRDSDGRKGRVAIASHSMGFERGSMVKKTAIRSK